MVHCRDTSVRFLTLTCSKIEGDFVKLASFDNAGPEHGLLACYWHAIQIWKGEESVHYYLNARTHTTGFVFFFRSMGVKSVVKITQKKNIYIKAHR